MNQRYEGFRVAFPVACTPEKTVKKYPIKNPTGPGDENSMKNGQLNAPCLKVVFACVSDDYLLKYLSNVKKRELEKKY